MTRFEGSKPAGSGSGCRGAEEGKVAQGKAVEGGSGHGGKAAAAAAVGRAAAALEDVKGLMFGGRKEARRHHKGEKHAGHEE